MSAQSVSRTEQPVLGAAAAAGDARAILARWRRELAAGGRIGVPAQELQAVVAAYESLEAGLWRIADALGHEGEDLPDPNLLADDVKGLLEDRGELTTALVEMRGA